MQIFVVIRVTPVRAGVVQASLAHCSRLPHLLDLLHFLKDVGSDDGDHHLNSGQDGQDGDPDDLVVLEPVQQVVHTGGLLHSPGRVLILLPGNYPTD